jgi:hypothetical protein
MPRNALKETTDFQKHILEYLNNENKYVIRKSNTDFNKHYAMDIELLFKFFYDTQSETMEKLEKIYKDKTKENIIKHLNNEITKIDKFTNTAQRGIVHVLKHGIASLLRHSTRGYMRDTKKIYFLSWRKYIIRIKKELTWLYSLMDWLLFHLS